MTDRFETIMAMVVLIVLSYTFGYVVACSHYVEMDYHITLDHNNIILEDKKEKLIYFNTVDSIPNYIHSDNL